MTGLPPDRSGVAGVIEKFGTSMSQACPPPVRSSLSCWRQIANIQFRRNLPSAGSYSFLCGRPTGYDRRL